MESIEVPPEFRLEDNDISWQLQEQLQLEEKEVAPLLRRGSLDVSYSILGFITRKISEKSRQRIMSE